MEATRVQAVPRRPILCSANVAFLFPGRPLVLALEAAAAAGFRTVELLDPYVIEPKTLAAALGRLELTVDLMNLPMGDFAAGDRGFAGDPSRAMEFAEALDRADTLAQHIHPAKVNALAGRRVKNLALRTQLDYLEEQLARAADRFEPAGIKVVTELLNPIETPDYLIADVGRVRQVIGALAGRVGFQLDIYHLQRTRGELINTIRSLASWTWHVQVADAPWRSEPGTGEINVPAVLDAIVAAGYRGHVGLEYHPSGRCADPFAWMDAAGCVRA